jgi:hypothetical protein
MPILKSHATPYVASLVIRATLSFHSAQKQQLCIPLTGQEHEDIVVVYV